MHDLQRLHSTEILFEDQITLSDGRSKPYLVLLQLTSESLIIRPQNTNKISSLNNEDSTVPRNVTIERHPITRSFGFSIKGGCDTGFPILISRVSDVNAHLLNIGDAILNINNEDISDLTHDQVITKLRNISNNQVNLTIKYMNNMAIYLFLTLSKTRTSKSIIQNGLKIRKLSSTKIKQDQKYRSKDYSSKYHDYAKQQCFQLTIAHQQKNNNNNNSTIDDTNIQEYSLLYAYISRYLNGTDECRINAFQLYTFDGSQTGIIINNTFTQQNIWISRINTVIRNLTTRTITELNQTLLPSEQVFYATWVHEQVIYPNENHLPEWKAIFMVFKGSDLYIFDDNQSPPLCAYDFIRCTRVYPIIEVFIETVAFKRSIDDRRYCFTLILPNDLTNEYRYLSLESKIEYDDFILNYQRSLYISTYSIENRTFGCIYQGQICRLIIDINKGFEMYNNKTNIILWTFTFEQLLSSSDNGHDKIYFQFKSNLILNKNEKIIHMEVQCQHLRILLHVINAFLTVKFIGQQNNLID